MEFEAHRQKLFLTACRLTGSAADAEDLVQESYLRIARSGTGGIRNPEAYLTTVLTRLCIDHQRRARAARNAYAGQWLPEPLPTAGLSSPEAHAQLRDSLSMAFMVLLERLSPVERAVFVLREILDYSCREISAVVQKSEANCRKIFGRAQASLASARKRFKSDAAVQRKLLAGFIDACNCGDPAALEALLSDGIVLASDGGSDVKTALRPVVSRQHAARFLLGITRSAGNALRHKFVETNFMPSLLVFLQQAPVRVVSIGAKDTAISAVRLTFNREKIALAVRAAVQAGPWPAGEPAL